MEKGCAHLTELNSLMEQLPHSLSLHLVVIINTDCRRALRALSQFLILAHVDAVSELHN
jgi:hypothetical protein